MRIARVDANQPEIVKAARQMGASVWMTHTVGRGGPDLVLGFRGVNYMTELKDGSRVRSARLLTPDEVRFHAEWKGQLAVVESIADLVALLKP